MTNRTPKRTFLTRLSSLIIIQAAFVFAALWLVFYQPSGRPSTGSFLQEMKEYVAELAGHVADAPSLETARRWIESESASTSDALQDCHIAAARMLAPDPSGTLHELFRYVAPAPDSGKAVLDEFALSGYSESGMHDLLLLPDNHQIATISSPRHSIYVHRLTLVDRRPALLVVVAQHNLLISNRSSLGTVLAVLFIASAIITSLLVYSIRRRFQAPLRRLARGMEETARGESFVMPEINEDHELDSLAASFNTMSRQLLQQRRDVLQSNQLLHESNQTLQESQLFLRALLDSTPLCVIAASADGRVMLFNRQAGLDFKCTPEEALGRPIREFIPAPSKADRAALGPESVEDVLAYEARCRRRTREYFPAYIISAQARDIAGRMLASIFLIRDITESRNFQEMMVRLDRNYTRGEMAGDIAHEINNYLAILSGNIELMAMILDQGDRSKIDKKLSIMKDTTEKIARFTDGLMDGPHEAASFEKTDLNQLVENVLAFLKPQNKFDKIAITTELSPDLPLVEIDTAQIQQLLVNFIYNAADAVGEGDGERRIVLATRVVTADDVPCALIEVRDSGPGVAADRQPMLFVKRFTTKPKGHGIGLITCKRIVESHGGVVAYEDAEGTVFWSRIPITHPRSEDTRLKVSSAAQETSPVSGY